MQSVMGKLPGSEKQCPLDMKVHEETDRGGHGRQLISYASEPNCRVPAYLLIPKAVRDGTVTAAPAALCLHSTNRVVGHGEVVGLGRPQKPNRDYANELADRGYVVLAPNYPLLAKYQPDLQALGWGSGTLKAVWDNIRGVDLLQSLPYVMPEKLAVIGHSLGGHNAVFTAVFDKRLKVVVSSCGFDSFVDYARDDPTEWLPDHGWTQTLYMPKLARYRGRVEQIPFDFHEVIAAIAPRPVLIIAPQHDDFSASSVDRVAAAASKVYTLYGHLERLSVKHPDCKHDFPPKMRNAAYDFIDASFR
jgi:dienelactone hydrolase